MKKMILIILMLLTVCSYAGYNVGDTIDSSDNINWTISGPAGNPEVGNSSDIFTKTSELTAVVIFLGGYG